MSNKHYFHFTLGPVQGFVSQARRTRDFWAGSFILSWLAAVAIQATQHQEGNVEFPQPDEGYMKWLIGHDNGQRPTQGSIPNRFKGMVATVDPETFVPEQVIEAVQAAWKALADKVWEQDLADLTSPTQRTIWERQISNFWDVSWVITADQNDSAALDKRKNWRSYTSPEEPGVKCSMMDGWQELSGEPRPNRKEMNRFWDAVRDEGRAGMQSDLAENEALCAIAFVKRRFSRHFAKLDVTMPQGWRLKGWSVPSTVPSVAYMAAVPWLEIALGYANTQDLHNFHDAAAELTGDEYGEWETNIRCLREHPKAAEFRHLRSLDGNVFFKSQLENKNAFPDQRMAKYTLDALNAVNKSADLEPVSPFYAILMMDGDSLGSHMSDPDKQQYISQGLSNFTKNVPQTVDDWNGFLIYAGGDDVLAILPLEDAIPCATALRKLYLSCFDATQIPTTLSGAIEFVHIKMPLTKVLKDAHSLLDEVAKDGRGRDALAIRVWKPGGSKIEWAQPWEIALNPHTDKTYLEEIAEKFRNGSEEPTQFSNKFFYKIAERFDLLNPNSATTHERVLNDEQALDLLAMEYLNSGKSRLSTREQARDFIRPLLKQCHPVIRNKDHVAAEWTRSAPPEVDGALLVRFLAQKGVES